MIDLDGLEGIPYNNLPYTTPDNAFGEPGKDWFFAGADEAGQANEQGGNVGRFKYYNYTTPIGTFYIAQAKVTVTSYKTVSRQVTKTVTEIIPATPPRVMTKHNSTTVLPYYRNGWSKTDEKNVGLAVQLAGVRVNAAQKAGKLTSIDFVAGEDNPITQGIIAGLEKTYGVPVNTTYNPKLTSDYTFKANFDTTTTTSGTPAQTVTKTVTETQTEQVPVTEEKQ